MLSPMVSANNIDTLKEFWLIAPKGSKLIIPVVEPTKFIYFSTRPVNEHYVSASAVRLQKVYKCYRTWRNRADCAVVVQELWWDIGLFQVVSFFNIEKPEIIVS
ncbi:hypothetical protein C5167_038411 [Papaver somniferum]|uniref:Uncharacterized protein n=1 Tax=Papaver somniferum TaxID=3469 RepID=A0A4Y7IDG8_PAPSO|nr:hypothetical protein C5167_038411 [Papaver somniferum]